MSETFMGVPAADPSADLAAAGARVALLGAGMASPYRGQGAYAARGPAALRAAAAPWADLAGHVNFDLGRVGWEAGAVVDCGDLALDPADGAGNRLRIRQAVAAILGAGAGAVPVVLGGDCSVAVPVLQGFDGHGPVAVLQIDAHIDWREQIEGERWGLSSAMRRVSEMGQVAAMVQVGARGIGSARPADLAAARDWGARIVTAEALDRDGPAAALAGLPAGMPVVVALDVDALDPAVMPAVMAPAAGGLGYRDVLGLLRAVAARGPVAGLVMTELVPEQDIDGQGVRLAAQLLTSALGLLADRTDP
ncbi:MAG: arginase family protein [Alkalilacustris sp.]